MEAKMKNFKAPNNFVKELLKSLFYKRGSKINFLKWNNLTKVTTGFIPTEGKRIGLHTIVCSFTFFIGTSRYTLSEKSFTQKIDEQLIPAILK